MNNRVVYWYCTTLLYVYVVMDGRYLCKTRKPGMDLFKTVKKKNIDIYMYTVSYKNCNVKIC